MQRTLFFFQFIYYHKVINKLTLFLFSIHFLLCFINSRMISQRYGIVPIRKCLAEQEKMIKDKYQEIKQVMEKNRGEQIYWAHLYLNENYHIQNQEQCKGLMKWAEKLLLEVENGVPQYIISMGYSNNPSTNIYDQHFHFDYNMEYKNIFIPMTDLVYENSPQFFQFPLQSEPKINNKGYLERYGSNEKQLLEQEGVDFLTISQVISKPYVIMKLFPGTIHRGIKNTTKQDRPMFYIGYSPNKMILATEEPIDT